MPSNQTLEHPLYPVLMAAIEQAMHGKGERHGGAATPFLEQPMFHYIKMHGRGFATGQAAKKLEEAASTRTGQAFEQEVLGAIVYAASAILAERADRAKLKAEISDDLFALAKTRAQAEVQAEGRTSIDNATPEEWEAMTLAQARLYRSA